MGIVNVLAWQVAYVGFFPQEYLDRRDAGARGESWRKVVTEADPLRRYLVAVEAGEVLGFAAFGRITIENGDDWTGEPEPGVGELTVINVHPDHWSRGVGTALLAGVDAGLAGLGYREQILWVITGNAKARRWYEHRGWRPDGGTLYVEAEGAVFDQVRYRRPVRQPRQAR